VAVVLQEHVGLIAVNDSFYLECTIYTLLRKHFRHQPYYTDLLDLFHDVSNTSCPTLHYHCKLGWANYVSALLCLLTVGRDVWCWRLIWPIIYVIGRCGISYSKCHTTVVYVVLFAAVFFHWKAGTQGIFATLGVICFPLKSSARYCYGKSSVCPSVCDVEISWSHRLEFFKKVECNIFYTEKLEHCAF